MKKNLLSYCLSLTLTALLWFPWASNVWADELTVADGTDNSAYHPLYGNYTDYYQRNQIIYPATLLSEMSGKNITGLVFYLKSKAAAAWTGAAFTVAVAEITDTDFGTSTYPTPSYKSNETTIVYSGSLDGTNSTMTITFDEAYLYSGGNLLVEIRETTKGTYKDASFFGVSGAYGDPVYSLEGHNSSSLASISTPNNANRFLPKTTFTYESSAPITCAKPTDLEVPTATITASSATVTWSTEAASSNLQYKAGSADWVTIEGVTSPYNLTVVPETNYQVKVQAVCGAEDMSNYTSVVGFTTPCGARSLPFEEDFSSALSSCWTFVDCESGTTVESGKFKFKWNKQPPQYLITPELNTAGKAVTVEFNYWIASSSFPETFQVGYSTTSNDVSAFTYEDEVTATNTSSTSPSSYSTTFPAETKYVAFKYNSNDMNALYLDNLKIKGINSCADPTELSATSVTSEGATLSWTAGGTETAWTVQYSTSSTFASDNYEEAAATNTNLEITGLAPSTKYYVHVKAVCGSESESDYSDAISFTTSCAAIADATSWTEGFEDYATGSATSEAPGCWSFNNVNVGGAKPNAYVSASAKHNGNNGLYMDAFGDEGHAFIIFPEIVTALNTLQVRFWHQEEIAEGVLELGYLTNVANTETFTSLHTCAASVATWAEEAVNLSTVPTGVRLAFRYIGSTDYFSKKHAYIDDISFEALPSCTKPVLADATDVTPQGATFTWTAGADETQYDYCVVASGETADGWETLDENVRTFTVTGKNANTAYDFYVRSNCGGTDGVSEAVKKSFTTASIAAPTGVAITNITNSGATASWTAAEGIAKYQYCVVLSGNAASWDKTAEDITTSLNGLLPNTTYDFYVRSLYEANGATAAAEKVTFTTLCNPIEISASAYEEHFDAFPGCWNNSEGTTTNNNYKWSSVTGGQEGNCVRFEGIENGYNKTNILASPLFTLNADADLTFYWKNAKTGDYRVKIAVDGVDREDLVTGLISNNAWQQKEVSLGAYKNHTIQLFFYGTSANDGNANLYLDELAITPQSCRKPAELNAATGITAEGATLTWTAGGANTDYQYAVAEAGQTPVWDAANVVSATTVTLTGLQASTSYDFYVRTYCDAENQSEARKVSFRTGCGVITALPWEENFESVLTIDGVPECWDKSLSTLSSYSYEWKLGNSYSGRNGGKAMQCGLAVEEAGKQNILATPSIQLGTKNMLTFWCKKSAGDSFVVEISADGGSSKTQLIDLTSEALTDWTLKYVDLSAYNNEEVILYFKATSAGDFAGDMIYIDDVRVARGEVFADSDNNASRFAELVTAGETMDVIFNRTVLCNGDYNTFCLPFDLSAEQIANSPIRNFSIKAFDYAAIENEELIISIMPASGITAGVPYFIANNTSAANQTVQLYKDVVITASTPGSKTSTDVTFQAVFNPVVLNEQAEGDSHNQLFLAAGNIIYWPAQDKTVKGFRAYFEVNTGGPLKIQKGMPARLVEHANTTTGCENVNGENVRSMKVLENNQVIIIRNGVKYTIQGQKIQ